MMHKQENLAPLPSLWRTIATGFDLTTRHLWLLILPVCLDAFLWLGPRLSSRPLIEQLAALLPQDPALQDITAQLLTMAPRTNLFTALSAPLVGIPVLMVGLTPEKTPLPTPITEINNPLTWLGLFLALSLFAILLTALYNVLIAQAVRLDYKETPLSASVLANRFMTTWLKLLGLGLIFVVIGVTLYIPLLVISFIAAFFSQFLATMVLMAGPVLLIWFFIFVYFVPHSLALHGLPLHRAILLSGQIVRTYFGQMLLLLLVILLFRNVLGALLLLADDGSWLTAVGLLGHAFIMTALVSATYVFFRDRYIFLFEQQKLTQGFANG
ncbi:MAG: hypothetical protein R6X34_11365 [Chloroflexota bacterium]